MKIKPLIQFRILILLLLVTLHPSSLFASSQVSNEACAVVEKLLNQAEADIDLLSTLLTIEQIIDPTVNIPKVRAEINKLVKNITAQLHGHEPLINIITLIGKTLYENGRGNSYRPYQYDFDDPLGTKISNKLISNYIRTHKGNCVSMPILYLVVTNKLGIDSTLSTAPMHLLVMVKDPNTHKYFNVEATHKGQVTAQQFYIDKLGITPLALQSTIYLQPLSKKEIIAVMAITLSEHYAELQQWEQSIAVAKLAVKQYSNYAYAMVKIANGYYKLLSQAVVRAENGYTAKEKEHMDYLYKKNITYMEKAESLGWEQPSFKQNQEYFKSIKFHKPVVK